MKKLLVIIVLLISGTCRAQRDDSIPVTTQQLKEAIIIMRTNLDKSDKEFNLGMNICLLGAAGGLGFSYLFHDENNNRNNAVLWSGIGISFIGEIIMLDSHRLIGKAGRWRFNPGGVITYNL